MSEEKIRLFERRCTNCNALLFKAVIEVGKIECKCGKCGVTNKIEATKPERQTFFVPNAHARVVKDWVLRVP